MVVRVYVVGSVLCSGWYDICAEFMWVVLLPVSPLGLQNAKPVFNAHFCPYYNWSVRVISSGGFSLFFFSLLFCFVFVL